MTPELLQQLLTATCVRQVEFHDEIGSTNDRGLELASDSQSAPGPWLIWAGRQTAGRGRGGNAWWSAPGSLTFSVVIDTTQFELPSDRWPQVALVTGLAVCGAVRPLLPGVLLGVKWPNDVYASGRKICGILVEVPPQRNGRLVIGIGLNVGNSFAEAPLELREKAAALSDLVPVTVTPGEILINLLQHLESLLRQLSAGFAGLLTDWDSLCLLRDRWVTHQAGERITQGRCLGVDQDGALLLEAQNTTVRLLGGVIVRWE